MATPPINPTTNPVLPDGPAPDPKPGKEDRIRPIVAWVKQRWARVAPTLQLWVGAMATGRGFMGLALVFVLGIAASCLLYVTLQPVVGSWAARNLMLQSEAPATVREPLKKPSKEKQRFQVFRFAINAADVANSLSLPEDDPPSPGTGVRLTAVGESKLHGLSYADVDLPRGEVLDCVRYQVFKGGSDQPSDELVPILLIEVRRERFDDRVDVLVELAYRSNGEWVLLPWWTVGNIAPSPQVATIQFNLLYPVPTFPTSQTAFATWLREQWPEVAKSLPGYGGDDSTAKLSDATYADFLGPHLERLLNHDIGTVQTRSGVLAARILGGLIQVVTLGFFFAALVCTACRYVVFVIAENVEVRALTQHRKIRERKTRFDDGGWGAQSSVLEIGLDVAMAQKVAKSSYVPEELAAAVDHAEALRTTDRFLLRFLVAAIPAVGFIGTVYGIGDALGMTSSVLSDQLARQQSGVATISLALGLAFDTTLIALVLSIIVLLVTAHLTATEERVIQEARESCRDFALGAATAATGASNASRRRSTKPSTAISSSPASPVPPNSHDPAPAPNVSSFQAEPNSIEQSVWPVTSAISLNDQNTSGRLWAVVGLLIRAGVVAGFLLAASNVAGGFRVVVST